MKPLHELALAVRFNGGNTCITAEGHGIVAYGELEWLQFFAATADMARELVKATARCPMGCECGMCAALRKGRVIP